MSKITLPKQIEKATKPAPTKAEVLDALTHRKVAQLKQEFTDTNLAYEQAKKAYKESAFEDLKSSVIDESLGVSESHPRKIGTSGYHETDYSRINQITCTMKAEPSEKTKRLHLKMYQLSERIRELRNGPSTFYDVKRMIRAQMSGQDVQSKSDRVSHLLTDKASSAALDKLLEALNPSKTKALPAPAEAAA